MRGAAARCAAVRGGLGGDASSVDPTYEFDSDLALLLYAVAVA
jgi:hypothetical protein